VNLARAGIDVAIAYGLFAALALFVSLMSPSNIATPPVTLADLTGTTLVLLAIATVGAPYVWHDRRAALAFIVPFAVTLSGLWPLYEKHRARQDALAALGEFGKMIEPAAERLDAWTGSPFDNLSVGAYVLFATAVYLAVRGAMRAFGR
jgi:hypothetical protein